MVPAFYASEFQAERISGKQYYNLSALRSYLGIALGKVKVALGTSKTTPITEQRQFGFVHDHTLRSILERDYDEIQRAYIGKCWKSVIVFCGGPIEAILADLLLQQSSKATTAKMAPPKEPDITKWDLKTLIAVAVELTLVSTSVEKLSNPVREYRNLIHPGNELRNKLTFDAEETRIALEVLHILHRDLSK